MLRENSPALNAERIKTPLLVVQGANDPRVNINESNQMVDALRKRGVHVDYMVKNNEGHGFHNEGEPLRFLPRDGEIPRQIPQGHRTRGRNRPRKQPPVVPIQTIPKTNTASFFKIKSSNFIVV